MAEAHVKGEIIPSFAPIKVGGWLRMVSLKRVRRVILSAIPLLFNSQNGNGAPSAGGPPHEQSLSGTAVESRLSAFRLKPGFRIQLVAAEPRVTAPVAVTFDEDGRLFVVERSDASGAAGPHTGRVRLLENQDTNGVFQSSTIFADNLSWPSAIACYAGGVFVAAMPDLLYLKDTNHDGVAGIKQVALTGFGGTNQISARSLPNNFNWGLDNRIHGATAGLGGLVVAPNWAGGPVSLKGADFSLEPRTLEVMPEAGPAQSGLTFDSQGRKFVTDFARPLRMVMFDRRYATRNPFYANPRELLEVLSPATPVYRFANSSARRTSEQVTVVQGMNVLMPGWMMSAQGSVVYRDGAFPTNYMESVFIADPELHLVHHAVLRENGLEPVAERASDESTTEFLACRDASFRPVQLVNGPDAALYVVDAQDGKERGRIYRIVPNNFLGAKPPQLGKAKTANLVRSLAEGDGWHRDTAARLLFERQDATVVSLLVDIINRSRQPLARVRALHVLDGLQALKETHLLRALSDADALVREHGVLLSERVARNGVVSDTLWNQLKGLAGDPSLRVRYQLACTVGEIQRPDKPALLAQLLRRDFVEPWVRNAVLSSTTEGADSLFVQLAADPRFRNDNAGFEFLRQLATMLGTQGRLDEVTRAIDLLARDQMNTAQTFALLYSLGEGLRRTHSSLALVDPQARLQRFYTAAFNTMVDGLLAEPVRVEATRLLGVSPYKFSDLSDWLLLMCTPPPSAALQSAAITALGRFDDPMVVPNLLQYWENLTPRNRNHAFTVLLSRESRVPVVVEALVSSRIPVTDLSAWQINFLRTYRDPSVSQRAIQLFGPVPLRRPAAVDQFRPALNRQGVAERGREIFRARCAECHDLGGQGLSLGPDLAGARTKGRDRILAALLEPNADIAPEYTTSIISTKDGEILVGIAADDELPTITLSQPNGTRVAWPRLNITSVHPQTWSLMPDGLEQGLSTQNMVDLLEYIMTGAK